MKMLLGVAAFALACAAGAVLAGSSSWRRTTDTVVDRLSAGVDPAIAPPAFEAAAVDTLPPPVTRYLRTAITDGHPIVRAAIATQEADFFINGNWRPLTATQHFSIDPPGFVWDARIDMAPLMHALVRDAYVDGHAMMQASISGVYTLADQVDTPQLNSGALQRFLGEMVWIPTALLPSKHVRWTPRDSRSSVVTLADGDHQVTLLFEFGDDGLPAMISGDRYKEDRGQYAMRQWQIICLDRATRDGLTIPLRCEVSWIVNGSREPYWRGRITSILYRYNGME